MATPVVEGDGFPSIDADHVNRLFMRRSGECLEAAG
jgi:hypothetical protein